MLKRQNMDWLRNLKKKVDKATIVLLLLIESEIYNYKLLLDLKTVINFPNKNNQSSY